MTHEVKTNATGNGAEKESKNPATTQAQTKFLAVLLATPQKRRTKKDLDVVSTPSCLSQIAERVFAPVKLNVRFTR